MKAGPSQSAVIADLARFGPQRQAAQSPERALAYCRQLAYGHYENFPVLSWCLPRALQNPFAAVYAYCRWADDLADEAPSPDAALELLDWWERELLACYAGSAWHPVFVTLMPVITAYRLPPKPFLDLLSAFRQDQVKTSYAETAELLDYCRRSADPVGELVLRLIGCADEQRLSASSLVCTGLQLTNFWQDVARDADRGRCYLPRDRWAEFGVTEELLARRQATPGFCAMLAALVADAERMLRAGLPLARGLPWRWQMPVELFAMGGLWTLRKIRKQNYDVWQRRPKLSRGDFTRLAAGTLFRWLGRRVWPWRRHQPR